MALQEEFEEERPWYELWVKGFPSADGRVWGVVYAVPSTENQEDIAWHHPDTDGASDAADYPVPATACEEREITVTRWRPLIHPDYPARQCPTILGVNDITQEYPVIRHAKDLESVRTVA